MLGSKYEGENCSAARALEVVGERWSLLIIRDALFRGMTRFGDFQRSLGVATNVLSARLEGFVASGLMEKSSDDDAVHAEYRLTGKGRDLAPVIIALTKWGDRWAAPGGPPVLYEHDCGSGVEQVIECDRCGPVDHRAAIHVRPGPGRTKPGTKTKRARRNRVKR